MELTQVTTYILALVLAAILPGPGMTGLMFHTLAKGYKNGSIMLLGLITGDIFFLLTSIFLVSSLIAFSQNLAFYFILLSSLYLLYLAYSFWFYQGSLIQAESQNCTKESFTSYRHGLLITLSNPKTISFYLALLPAIFGVKALQQQYLFLIVVTIGVLALVGGGYIFCSWYLKKLLYDFRIQKILLKILAMMMCVLALSMLYKELI